MSYAVTPLVSSEECYDKCTYTEVLAVFVMDSTVMRNI